LVKMLNITGLSASAVSSASSIEHRRKAVRVIHHGRKAPSQTCVKPCIVPESSIRSCRLTGNLTKSWGASDCRYTIHRYTIHLLIIDKFIFKIHSELPYTFMSLLPTVHGAVSISSPMYLTFRIASALHQLQYCNFKSENYVSIFETQFSD
jgi:hypothetical protein